MLIDMFFACFYTFYFLTQTDHFAKAMVFAWAIAFARWPIFKIVSFVEYLVFFPAVFLQNNSSLLVQPFSACFWPY